LGSPQLPDVGPVEVPLMQRRVLAHQPQPARAAQAEQVVEEAHMSVGGGGGGAVPPQAEV
jgi:hypothetical protein